MTRHEIIATVLATNFVTAILAPMAWHYFTRWFFRGQ